MPTGRRVSAKVGCPNGLPKFLLFGAISACCTLTVGWLLYETGSAVRLPYWCATGMGATIGMLVNFYLNYAFNFRFRDRTAVQQLRSYFLVSGIGVLLTALLSELNFLAMTAVAGDAIRFGGIAFKTSFAANMAAVGMVAVYSFPAHKFVSFNVGLRVRLGQMRAVVAGHVPLTWPVTDRG